MIIVLLLHSLSEPEAVRKRDEIAFFDRIKINREVVQEARCIFIYVSWVEETNRSIILEEFALDFDTNEGIRSEQINLR